MAIAYIQTVPGTGWSGSAVNSITYTFDGAAAVTEGNLLVLGVRARGVGADEFYDTPSGWSVASAGSSNEGGLGAFFYKIAGANETSLVLALNDPHTGEWGAACAEYSGVDETTPLDASSYTDHTGSTITSASMPALTPTNDGALFICGICVSSMRDYMTTDTVPSGYSYSTGWGVGLTTDGAAKQCHKILSGTSQEAPGNWTTTDAGNAYVTTHSMIFNPAGVGPAATRRRVARF